MKLAPKRLDSLFSVAYNCHDKLCLVGWLVVCLFAVGGGGGCGGGGGGAGGAGGAGGGGGGGAAAAAAAAEREVVFSTCVATERAEARGDL